MIAKVPDHELKKDSGQDTAEPASAQAKTPGVSAGQSFGAYGNNGYQGLNLSPQNWKAEEQSNAGKPWTSSLQGRFAIRAFARGCVGAAFFALGNRYCSYALNTDPTGKLKFGGYHPEQALADVHWTQKPMHFIAKCFDTVAGKPIELTVNMLGGDGKRAVTFRPTHRYSSGYTVNGKTRGRSLGHEVMGVTFDFAAMSVGDGLGQDIAGLFDPNVSKSWMKDGKINYPDLVKRMALNTWRYLSYNAGEDWAVALPYVYYVRAQRNLINHFSPGFKYDSDRGLNGGSFKVNDKGEVVGNYNVEGALDLQGRFTAYNIGTLMFRETYLGATKNLMDWYDAGMPAPQIDTNPKSLLQSAVDSIKSLTRWAARDTVKGTLYMTPAVPFFWMTRTPQTKYKGLFIHPEKGLSAYWNKGRRNPADGSLGYHDVVHANEMRHRHGGDFGPETPVYFRSFDEHTMRWDGGPERTVQNQFDKDGFHAYRNTYGTVDSMFNALGKMSNQGRREQHKWIYEQAKSRGYDWNSPMGAYDQRISTDKGFAKLVSDTNKLKDLQNAYTMAAISYTPYFAAKTDLFSYMWDSGRMDTAIERAIDGVSSLNLNEFKAGVGEIWQSMKGGPLKDPSREAEAQKAMASDLSPPDVFKPKLLDAEHIEQRKQRKFTEKVEQERREKAASFVEKTNEKQAAKASFAEQQLAERDQGAPSGVTIH